MRRKLFDGRLEPIKHMVLKLDFPKMIIRDSIISDGYEERYYTLCDQDGYWFDTFKEYILDIGHRDVSCQKCQRILNELRTTA